jgi:D-cysteine desulfhydrase
VAELPILRRFPALSTIPRANFGTYPTPIDRIVLGDGRALLVKRDDRSATPFGGNKVRGLEWLLGAVRAGDRIVTVGSRGSTHALAVALYAKRLGARVSVARWDQQMNAAARRVDARLRREAQVYDMRGVPWAYAAAAVLRAKQKSLWIPAGGASPLAGLGHVNAALELADQITRGECERPERVVVPLGTGGTAAGLSLGFRIAGLATRVIAVRVVPRVLGRLGRVMRLARATASLIERVSGQDVPSVEPADVTVVHDFYGRGYGHPLQAAIDEEALAGAGISLDDTYSRKAFNAAAAQRNHRTLLWLTFDGRLLQD